MSFQAVEGELEGLTLEGEQRAICDRSVERRKTAALHLATAIGAT
jgi:hypothetical protein